MGSNFSFVVFFAIMLQEYSYFDWDIFLLVEGEALLTGFGGRDGLILHLLSYFPLGRRNQVCRQV